MDSKRTLISPAAEKLWRYSREDRVMKDLAESYHRDHPDHRKQCHSDEHELSEDVKQKKDTVVLKILTEHHAGRSPTFGRKL